ncbi:hypothetical protein BZA05DRAFT_419287 [Tricharina praecox]|uniref:uncharacterized protein n=1 Tax=Tricharina praecox TaxID=43433 RepID=UPI00221FDE35|nr:uncharacterized protein BZA05DRAFT_419287 [Tricharina praecox]KAI5850776.1 hypothetical protein BZA05DRAFT_419287 [Tricharina praecox]
MSASLWYAYNLVPPGTQPSQPSLAQQLYDYVLTNHMNVPWVHHCIDGQSTATQAAYRAMLDNVSNHFNFSVRFSTVAVDAHRRIVNILIREARDLQRGKAGNPFNHHKESKGHHQYQRHRSIQGSIHMERRLDSKGHHHKYRRHRDLIRHPSYQHDRDSTHHRHQQPRKVSKGWHHSRRHRGLKRDPSYQHDRDSVHHRRQQLRKVFKGCHHYKRLRGFKGNPQYQRLSASKHDAPYYRMQIGTPRAKIVRSIKAMETAAREAAHAMIHSGLLWLVTVSKEVVRDSEREAPVNETTEEEYDIEDADLSEFLRLRHDLENTGQAADHLDGGDSYH